MNEKQRNDKTFNLSVLKQHVFFLSFVCLPLLTTLNCWLKLAKVLSWGTLVMTFGTEEELVILYIGRIQDRGWPQSWIRGHGLPVTPVWP